MDKKNINILLITCDWRDDFRSAFSDFKDKLHRDHLNPNQNNFFVIAWTYASSYGKRTEKFSNRHVHISKFLIKPVSDLISSILFPYIFWKSEFKPDAIVVYDFGLVPAALACKLLYGGKIVMVVNNMPRKTSRVRSLGRIKGAYSYILEKLFYYFPDYFFTINETMKGYLFELGVPIKKISIFPVNTIERDMDLIRAHRKDFIREKYNLHSGEKVLLVVGRLEVEKNHKTLIELFSQLGTEYVLCIVGRGSLGEELKLLAERLGVSDRVHFEGLISRDRIWDYYADSDVFVLLSKVEALGIVFWEAMFMNVPVIGSDFPGIVESIGDDEKRGRIWKVDDGVKGFREKVEFCISESAEKKEMIMRARNYVEDMISRKIEINDFF